jgi:hypothetical protein
MTSDHREVGIHAGDLGTITAIARDKEVPEFPTVYVQLDAYRRDLVRWDNELMLTCDCYLDLTDADRGIDSRIDPDSIVASMEKADVLRSEQGRSWLLGGADAA